MPHAEPSGRKPTAEFPVRARKIPRGPLWLPPPQMLIMRQVNSAASSKFNFNGHPRPRVTAQAGHAGERGIAEAVGRRRRVSPPNQLIRKAEAHVMRPHAAAIALKTKALPLGAPLVAVFFTAFYPLVYSPVEIFVFDGT